MYKNYVNSRFNICCNELKIKFLVSKNIKYEAFEINLYHNKTKICYINIFCAPEKRMPPRKVFETPEQAAEYIEELRRRNREKAKYFYDNKMKTNPEKYKKI